MPLYEFCCKKCGFVFEEITSADSPSPSCPECGGDTYRLICPVSFKINDDKAVRRIEKRFQYYVKGGKYKDAARFLAKATEFVKDDRVKRLREKVETKLSKSKK
jgi:putative FmdB family regulatory protein